MFRILFHNNNKSISPQFDPSLLYPFMSLSIYGPQIIRRMEISKGVKSFEQRIDSTKQHVSKHKWTLNQQMEKTIDRCEIL
jgi:hypothetical protein